MRTVCNKVLLWWLRETIRDDFTLNYKINGESGVKFENIKAKINAGEDFIFERTTFHLQNFKHTFKKHDCNSYAETIEEIKKGA